MCEHMIKHTSIETKDVLLIFIARVQTFPGEKYSYFEDNNSLFEINLESQYTDVRA